MKEPKKKVTAKSKNTTNKKRNTNKSTKSNGSIDNMKYEIANELGINLGAESTSRANGSVGGEITKRLVQNGKNKLSSNRNKNSN